MTFATDTPDLYLRDCIDLDQELANELRNRGGTRPLVLIADMIMLSGAEIADRDVTLVAGSVTAGVSGVPLRLYRSGTAADGVLTQEGVIEPPVPVLGTAPQQGATGPTLTVLCKALLSGSAESRGQQGGRGLQGPTEIRDACHMTGGESFCDGMTPAQLSFVEGNPGGRGLKGGVGGAGGIVTVACVQDFVHNEPEWRGVGGPGGLGGPGGTGGPGGNDAAPSGDPGETGSPGDVPGPVRGRVEPITEDEFYRRVKALGVVVEFPLVDSVAELWAEFVRRRAAAELRETGEMITDDENDTDNVPIARRSLDQASLLAPESTASSALRRHLRNHSTQHGIERDVDLTGAPEAFETQLIAARASMATVVQPLLPVPEETEIPNLLLPNALAASMRALRTELGARLAAGEFTLQRNESGSRLSLARAARRSAHIARLSVDERLGARLGGAGIGFALQFPLAGVTLGRDALQSLRGTLLALAPKLAVDNVENPDPPAQPSNDAAVLLPMSVALLVHRTVHTDGPYLAYPPDVPTPPRVFGLADRASWPKALQAGTGDAIDLTRLTAELRSALRPSAGAPLTDPLALDIANGLIELAEATHSWRLADLRLEQAVAADALIADAAAEASAALAALPVNPTGNAADYPGFLRGLQALGDILSWHTHRAHRAHDLYTLDLTPFDLRRSLGFEQFDPDDAADLRADVRGPQTQSEAAKAARTITTGLDRAATTSITPGLAGFRARGTEVTDFLANRVFCSQAAEGGTDCTVASPQVFAALQDPLQAGFWLDVDLSDVQGPHREAKINGAVVRFSYDLAAGDAPPDRHDIRLVHQGFGRQRQLESDTVHHQYGLPRVAQFSLLRLKDDVGQPTSVWEGIVKVDSTSALNFPAYGRGVAAGYRVELVDQTTTRPELLTRVEVRIQYEARQELQIVNLRSVALSSGLRPGMIASAAVTLTGPAPLGGTRIRLRSSDSAVLKVPAEVLVPAGSANSTFPVEVLRESGPVPPSLTASSLDGVNRHALVPVAKLTGPLRTAVTVDGAGSAFAVALGRLGAAPTTGSKIDPTVFVTHSPPADPDEPAGDGPGNSVHAFRADLTELSNRSIGFWPRSVDVDGPRGRLYVVHGSTVSLLDARTMATRAEHLIGINATNVAIDTRAELAYVTRYSHGTVHVLRGADLAPVGVFGTLQTLRRCVGLAFDQERSMIYLARNFRIAEPTATAVTRVVRRPDGTHVIDRDVTVGPVARQPQSIAVDAKAGLVFVGCLGGGGSAPVLLVLDANTLATLHTVGVPGGVQAVASREGTGIAYLTTHAGLHLVDGRTGSLALTVKAGRQPQGLAVDQATGVAYVVDRLDHTITRIETPPSVTARPWQ